MVMRFACQPGCTACCEQKGFVYLTEADIQRAAEHLEMAPAHFERRFVYRTRNLRRLRVARQARCPFLLAGGCSIHPAKPTQCRIFPFWPEVMGSARGWRTTARYCPGIGKGELIQIEAARAEAAEMKAAHPVLYP